MNIPTDCLNCGVCCFSKSPTYIRVHGTDWARLGEQAEHFAQFVGQRAYMRMEDGHCIALRITTQPGRPPEFFCSVYEQRPQVCRDLGRGSRECEGELSTKADAITGKYDR